ncbi:MAG: DegT/DnrJ/EryC1/StrS family aminotransferase, partial [Candidatus Natronoplasma sp.]
LIVPMPPDNRFDPVYQMYTIRVLKGLETRNDLMSFLKEKGIITKVYFDPVHEYTVFKKFLDEEVYLPNTVELSKQVISLPLYPSISKENLDYIVAKVKEFFKDGGEVYE